MSDTPNWYDVLGVASEATPEEIRRAYARQVRQINQSQGDPARHRQINEARAVLLDEQKRKVYDQERRFGDTVAVYTTEAVQALQADDYPTAARALKNALALAPDLPEPRQLLASVLLGQGDIAGAEAQFRRLLNQSPEDASLHYHLGGCLAAQDKNAEAEIVLRQSLQLNPYQSDALMSLAGVLRDMNRVDEAAEAIEQAIRLNGSEDLADLPLLCRLLTLYIVEEDAARYDAVAVRILRLIEDNATAAFVLAELFDLALEFSKARNYAGASVVLSFARHPLCTLLELLQALADLRESVAVRQDAYSASMDDALTLPLQGFLMWRHLDPEDTLGEVKDDLLENLHDGMATEPARYIAIVRHIRTTYPALAKADADILETIYDNAQAALAPPVAASGNGGNSESGGVVGFIRNLFGG